MGQSLRGQTLNRCFHLQLSNLFSWSLVHRTEDQAVSRLFVHGSPSSPFGLPVVEHGTTSHTNLVGDKPRVCGADVRDGRVLVHENRVADNPCEHGGRGNRTAAQNRPPLMWDLIMLQ